MKTTLAAVHSTGAAARHAGAGRLHPGGVRLETTGAGNGLVPEKIRVLSPGNVNRRFSDYLILTNTINSSTLIPVMAEWTYWKFGITNSKKTRYVAEARTTTTYCLLQVSQPLPQPLAQSQQDSHWRKQAPWPVLLLFKLR